MTVRFGLRSSSMFASAGLLAWCTLLAAACPAITPPTFGTAEVSVDAAIDTTNGETQSDLPKDSAADVAEVDAPPDVIDCSQPERCDGIDNDCDGETDEGVQTAAGDKLGTACGVGQCTGGVVVCTPDGGARCTADSKAVPEVCFDNLDNDCDGLFDEECPDVDGDGVPAPEDCNDLDSAIGPGAEEGCCPASSTQCLDLNCDGQFTACLDGDEDGDGHSAPSDCDETNPLIFPGAVEKCGDGIDQDCLDGDLACEDIIDDDGDGYANALDCYPDAEEFNPGAAEICDGADNDCDGIIDEGNPGGGAPCSSTGSGCIDGVIACAQGTLACVFVAGDPEVCDGKDNDCDGLIDEDFSLDDAAIGEACVGLGFCGEGVVECTPDGTEAICSSMPGGSAAVASPERCDVHDNDCDGSLNEGQDKVEDSTCSLLGVCGVDVGLISAQCGDDGAWKCDYSAVPGYEVVETLCDGLDNDCDGFVDEPFNVGQGCDGEDSDLCANGTLVCGTDGTSAFCDEVSVLTEEICDGLDNDCDGEVDEGFPLLGEPCDGPDTDQCTFGVFECAPDGSGVACLTEDIVDIEELCDGVDNNCDGEVDETFPALGKECDGVDTDYCKRGVFECSSNMLGVVCVEDATLLTLELCDTPGDDDCDGLVNEGCADASDESEQRSR